MSGSRRQNTLLEDAILDLKFSTVIKVEVMEHT